MPFVDQMVAGINLMALGMGIVFSFLVILVFALKGMSILAEYLHGPIEEFVAKPSVKAAPVSPAEPDSELVAVITAAISRFRANRNL